jgi:hypothetical protein
MKKTGTKLMVFFDKSKSTSCGVKKNGIAQCFGQSRWFSLK